MVLHVTFNQRRIKCNIGFHFIHKAFIMLAKWLHENMKTFFAIFFLDISTTEQILGKFA